MTFRVEFDSEVLEGKGEDNDASSWTGSTSPNDREARPTVTTAALQVHHDDTLLAFGPVYRACLHQGDPTPVALVTQTVPGWILGDSRASVSSNDGPKTHEWMYRMYGHTCLESIETLLCPPSPSLEGVHMDKHRRRQLQVQALLRLQFVAMFGDTFAHWYAHQFVNNNKKAKTTTTNKRKRRRKTHPLGPRELLLDHVTALLSAVSVLLPSTTTVSAFLRTAIPMSMFRSIPDMVRHIFHLFELPDPFVQHNEDQDDSDDDDDDDCHAIRADLTPSKASAGTTLPPPTTSPNPPASTLATTDPPPSTAVQDKNAWMNQSVALTAPKPTNNPLLSKGRRHKYVASHFNTKLSNIGNLFREAPLSRGRPIRSLPKASLKRRRPILSLSSQALSKSQYTNPLPSLAHRLPSSTFASSIHGSVRHDNIKTTPRSGIASETPLKRAADEARPLNAFKRTPKNRNVHNNNNSVSRLVSETPLKATKGVAARRHTISFALVESPVTPNLGESQNSFHFVAEAAQAAKRTLN